MTSLEIEIALDQPLVCTGQASRIHARVAFTAPEPEETAKRLALNVGVVVDRSGSMSGSRLQNAIASIVMLIDQLTPEDRLTVVAFDDKIRTIIPNSTVDHPEDLKTKVRRIQPGGATDLHAGWTKAAALIRPHVGPDRISRLLVLTDGHANAGITDPEALSGMSNAFRSEGIETTAMGYGDGFNEDLLQRIAVGGDGRFYFIQEPRDAKDIFATELGTLQNLFARNVTVLMEAEPWVTRIELMNAVDHETVDGKICVRMGNAYARERRYLIFGFDIPAQTLPGRIHLATARLDSISLSQQNRSNLQDIEVEFALPQQGGVGQIDLAVLEELAPLDAARARIDALALADAGDLVGALAVFRAFRDLYFCHIKISPAIRKELVRLAIDARMLADESNYNLYRKSSMSYAHSSSASIIMTAATLPISYREGIEDDEEVFAAFNPSGEPPASTTSVEIIPPESSLPGRSPVPSDSPDGVVFLPAPDTPSSTGFSLGSLADEAANLMPSAWLEFAGTSCKIPREALTFTLGRDPERCDLQFENSTVSSLHALILRVGDHYRLVDCDSGSGTSLAGHPVQNEVLNDGDTLTMGDVSCLFRCPDMAGNRQRLTPSRGSGLLSPVLRQLEELFSVSDKEINPILIRNAILSQVWKCCGGEVAGWFNPIDPEEQGSSFRPRTQSILPNPVTWPLQQLIPLIQKDGVAFLSGDGSPDVLDLETLVGDPRQQDRVSTIVTGRPGPEGIGPILYLDICPRTMGNEDSVSWPRLLAQACLLVPWRAWFMWALDRERLPRGTTEYSRHNWIPAACIEGDTHCFPIVENGFLIGRDSGTCHLVLTSSGQGLQRALLVECDGGHTLLDLSPDRDTTRQGMNHSDSSLANGSVISLADAGSWTYRLVGGTPDPLRALEGWRQVHALHTIDFATLVRRILTGNAALGIYPDRATGDDAFFRLLSTLRGLTTGIDFWIWIPERDLILVSTNPELPEVIKELLRKRDGVVLELTDRTWLRPVAPSTAGGVDFKSHAIFPIFGDTHAFLIASTERTELDHYYLDTDLIEMAIWLADAGGDGNPGWSTLSM